MTLRFLLPALLLAACSQPASEPAAQDAAPATGAETPAPMRPAGMVAAANPMAVEAGLAVLREGGDAVDAAVAVQAVLGLVEPQSSGIGGGGFLVRYDAATASVTVYDGRETAPAAADEDLFLQADGSPYTFLAAWQSGRSTGVPGVIAMLAMAHADHGRIGWDTAFEPAIGLAEEGFPVPPRLSNLTARIAPVTALDEREPSASYFYDEAGAAWPTGHILTNPAYARTLRAIAADWRNFYTGEIAQGIVDAAQEEPLPGLITMADLEAYVPVRRAALCTPYRGYQVCSAPPPASGGVAVGQIMGMLEAFDMASFGPQTAEGWHLFIEASRLAYADRDHYVGDPAFADVPVTGLLDASYLADRAALIDPDRTIPVAVHGTPPGAPDVPQDASDDAPGTSHFVIVDGAGNVVSMTTTVESAFGNNRMTSGGFLLNNQLTDFSLDPRDPDGRLRPNAPAAGKRPRSSMSPVIVLDDEDRFVLATGSPGGNSIIAYTAKSLVAMLDWGLSPAEAAALPNVVARGEVTNIEADFDQALLDQLARLGHVIEAGRGENSGIHIIRVTPQGGLEGAADPRRDGTASAP